MYGQTFKSTKQEFLRALDDAGLGVENGVKKGADAKKRTKKDKNVSGIRWSFWRPGQFLTNLV